MAGRGRPRKYTPRTLRKAVESYFRKNSRTVTMKEQVNTGQKDGWGHWIYEIQEVTNDAGEPVKILEFVVPPTVGGAPAGIWVSTAPPGRTTATG